MAGDLDINPYGVRAWVLDTLGAEFRTGCDVGVDAGHQIDAKFLKWTGHTYSSLQNKWKTSPHYSTCADFLTFVNTKICENNATRRGARYGFNGFGLNHCKPGWHPYAEFGSHPPKSGDFYLIHREGNPAETQHVGLLLDFQGNFATYLSGGGGSTGSSQKITCVQKPFPPHNLLGWLDIDEYYED
jgi:hypothetical protein